MLRNFKISAAESTPRFAHIPGKAKLPEFFGEFCQ
jgi:hypothetical protein